MKNSRSFLKVQRRSDAGWQPNLAKRRKWFSDEEETSDDETDTQLEKTGDTGENISLSKTALNDRLDRARRAAESKLLGSLGFKDMDSAKLALQAKKEDKGQADDLNQTIKELTDKINAIQEANTQAETARAKARQEQAIRDLAKKSGARDVDDVLRLIDTASITSDEGKLDDEKLKAAMESLRKNKAYLFDITPGSPSNFGDAKKPDVNKIIGDKPTVKF